MAKEEKEGMRESPGGRSMITLAQSCHRSWAWKYLLGFKTLKTPDHFPLGQSLHTANETFYKEGFNLEKSSQAGKDYLTDVGFQKLHLKFQVMLEEWYYQIGVHDISGAEVLMVEEEVFLTLPNGFQMTCRLDRLLRWKKSGEVFIGDTKTTSWSLEGVLRNYTYHDQPQLYYMAARETHPEIMKDCRGWKTDAIYAKEKVSQGEKTGVFYTGAHRGETIVFRESQLEDTLNSYAEITDDIAYRLAAVEKNGEPKSLCFPKNNHGCMAFNSPCNNYTICHKIDDIDGVPGDFEIDPWLESGEVLDRFRALDAYKEV